MGFPKNPFTKTKGHPQTGALPFFHVPDIRCPDDLRWVIPTICRNSSRKSSPRYGVSTTFFVGLCYAVGKLAGRRRIVATVASSSARSQLLSRISAASSPGGASGDRSDRCWIPSPSTPSLSKISTSPRRRDSFSTVIRFSPAESPGGGVAVPIFCNI